MPERAETKLARHYRLAILRGDFLDVSNLKEDGSGSIPRPRPVDNEWEGIGNAKLIEPLIVMSNNYSTYAYAIKLLGADEEYAQEFEKRYGTRPMLGTKLPSLASRDITALPVPVSRNVEPASSSAKIITPLLHRGKMLTSKEIQGSIDRPSDYLSDIHQKFLPIFGYFVSVPSCSAIFQLREALVDLGIIKYNTRETSPDDFIKIQASNGINITVDDLVRSIEASWRNTKIQQALELGENNFFKGVIIVRFEGQKLFRLQWGS